VGEGDRSIGGQGRLTAALSLSQAPPELLVVAAAISVQAGAALATDLLRTHDAIAVVALRLVLAFAVLAVLRRPRRPPDPRTAWRTAIVLGLVFVGMNTAFYVAIARIPLGVAVTLEFWGPLALAVAGSRRLRDVVWVLLAASGIYLISGGRLVADDLVGVSAALIAGLGWLCFVLVGQRLAVDWPDGRGLTAGLLVGAVVAVPIGFAVGDLGQVVTSPSALLLGLGVAVFSGALPWSFEMAAIGRLRARTYGVLASLEPAIAALVGFALLGQALGPMEVVAIVLVGVASAGASLTARRAVVTSAELEGA